MNEATWAYFQRTWQNPKMKIEVKHAFNDDHVKNLLSFLFGDKIVCNNANNTTLRISRWICTIGTQHFQLDFQIHAVLFSGLDCVMFGMFAFCIQPTQWDFKKTSKDDSESFRALSMDVLIVFGAETRIRLLFLYYYCEKIANNCLRAKESNLRKNEQQILKVSFECFVAIILACSWSFKKIYNSTSNECVKSISHKH